MRLCIFGLYSTIQALLLLINRQLLSLVLLVWLHTLSYYIIIQTHPVFSVTLQHPMTMTIQHYAIIHRQTYGPGDTFQILVVGVRALLDSISRLFWQETARSQLTSVSAGKRPTLTLHYATTHVTIITPALQEVILRYFAEVGSF